MHGATSTNDTTTATDRTQHPRLIGFDLVRLVSFFIISFYHFLTAVWQERVPEFKLSMATDPFFWHGVYPALRSMSFSGHTILFMSAMLIAMAEKSLGQILRFSTFLLLAWLGFVWADQDFQVFTPFWDIHPLILLGLVTIAAGERISPRFVYALALIGFASTWIAFWKFDALQALPLGYRAALIGDCPSENSSWPILPWLGFIWLGFGTGFALRQQSVRDAVSRWSKYETFFWIVCLLPSAFNLGGFYKLDALNDWECNAFRLPPTEFWSHFIFIVFAIRISLLTWLNTWLTRKLPLLRRLHVSKNFFLAYALQYLLGFVIAWRFGDFLRSHPPTFTAVGLLMLPLAEIVARLASPARRLFKGR